MESVIFCECYLNGLSWGGTDDRGIEEEVPSGHVQDERLCRDSCLRWVIP